MSDESKKEKEPFLSSDGCTISIDREGNAFIEGNCEGKEIGVLDQDNLRRIGKVLRSGK